MASNIFITGSKSLAVQVLDACVKAGHNVVGIHSRDHEAGMQVWLNELGHPSLEAKANELGIKVFKDLNINSEEMKEELQKLDVDLMFSVFLADIVKPYILNIPKIGFFNLHTAYLPYNRGSSPIPWAIIDQVPAGLTIHRMDAGVDDGPILAQVKVDITEDETAISLYEKVTAAGANLFEEHLENIASDNFTLQAQSQSDFTYHPRGFPYGGQINPWWDEDMKDRFKRAAYFPPFNNLKNEVRSKEPIGAYLVDLDMELPEAHFTDIIYISKDNTHSAYIIRGVEDGLDKNFKQCDMLKRRNIEVVFSKIRSTNQYLNQFQASNFWLQPHRYENGLLEVPCIDEVDEDGLNDLMARAEQVAQRYQRSIFIPILSGDLSSYNHPIINMEEVSTIYHLD